MSSSTFWTVLIVKLEVLLTLYFSLSQISSSLPRILIYKLVINSCEADPFDTPSYQNKNTYYTIMV